jgi:hypothetical protein
MSQEDFDRCDLEIGIIFNTPDHECHWLLLMGLADWETEKRLILKESSLQKPAD